MATTSSPEPAEGDDDVPLTFSDPCGYEPSGPGTWHYDLCAGGTPSNPADNSRTSGGGGCGEGGESSEIPFELLDWTRLFPETKTGYGGAYARDTEGDETWSGGDSDALNRLYDDFLAAQTPDVPTQVMADALLIAATALTPFPGDEEAAASGIAARMLKGASNARRLRSARETIRQIESITKAKRTSDRARRSAANKCEDLDKELPLIDDVTKSKRRAENKLRGASGKRPQDVIDEWED